MYNQQMWNPQLTNGLNNRARSYCQIYCRLERKLIIDSENTRPKRWQPVVLSLKRKEYASAYIKITRKWVCVRHDYVSAFVTKLEVPPSTKWINAKLLYYIHAIEYTVCWYLAKFLRFPNNIVSRLFPVYCRTNYCLKLNTRMLHRRTTIRESTRFSYFV